MKSFIPLVILYSTIRGKSHLIDATVTNCPKLDEPPFTANIPHETECGKFYICQKNKKIEVTCPSFLEFNAKIQICDWPEKANCSLKSKNVQYPDPDCTNLDSSNLYVADERDFECTDGQLLPHETNCNQYYRCVYGKKVLKICHHNMLFNRELSNCDFKYNVQCDSLIIDNKVKRREVLYEGDFLDDYIEARNNEDTASEQDDTEYWDDFLNQEFDESSTDSLSEGIDYLTTKNNLNFPIECPEVADYYEPILIPHEKKCNSYYKCSNGKKQLLHCPGMLQFNPKVLLCDLPQNAKCVERKTKSPSVASTSAKSQVNVCPQTKCQDSTMYLPSRTDIRQFIRCENGRQIDGDCPNGLVFDVNLKVCNLAHLAETISQQL